MTTAANITKKQHEIVSRVSRVELFRVKRSADFFGSSEVPEKEMDMHEVAKLDVFGICLVNYFEIQADAICKLERKR